MTWNKEAEMSVLGACLMDELAFEKVAAMGLNSKDFNTAYHQAIYKAIVQAANNGNGIDVITVGEELENETQLDECGGYAYLDQLTTMLPSIDNAGGYATIVKQHSRSRRLQNLGDTIAMMAREQEPEEVQDYAGRELMDIATAGTENRVHNAGQATKLALARLDELFNSTKSDWSTGLKNLDEFIRPEESRIYAVIGDTGSGKTTLAQTIAESSLKQGVPVYYASMEMPVEHMTNRFISSAGSVNRAFLKNPKSFRDADEQWSKLAAGTNILKDLPLTIDCTTSQNISALASKVRAWVRKERNSRDTDRAMLVVDYLGLMDMPGKDLVNELGEISKALKVLTNDLKICTILLAQVNRGVSTRDDKRPRKSDIRDSGKIENDMDAIIGVYREEYYNEDTDKKGVAELVISKSRDENIGSAFVRSELHYSRFSDLPSSGYQ